MVLLAVLWRLRYKLSFRDVAELCLSASILTRSDPRGGCELPARPLDEAGRGVPDTKRWKLGQAVNVGDEQPVERAPQARQPAARTQQNRQRARPVDSQRVIKASEATRGISDEIKQGQGERAP